MVWRAGKLLLSRSSPPRPSLTPIVTLSPPLSAAGAHVYLPEDFRQLTLEKSLSRAVNRMVRADWTLGVDLFTDFPFLSFCGAHVFSAVPDDLSTSRRQLWWSRSGRWRCFLDGAATASPGAIGPARFLWRGARPETRLVWSTC